jgi:hypothetical protein
MPKKFRLYIEPEVFNDIQDAVDYYKAINQKSVLSDEKTVCIKAVFCTHQNPENYHKRNKQ